MISQDGPWKAVHIGGEWFRFVRHESYDTDIQGDGLAQEKLARLNAVQRIKEAGPELLTALENVMSWIANWEPNFVEDAEWKEDEAKILAAIKLARGAQ